MTRYLCGRETTEDLGLNQPVPWLSALLFWGVLLLARLIDTVVGMLLPRFSIRAHADRAPGYHCASRGADGSDAPTAIARRAANQVGHRGAQLERRLNAPAGSTASRTGDTLRQLGRGPRQQRPSQHKQVRQARHLKPPRQKPITHTSPRCATSRCWPACGVRGFGVASMVLCLLVLSPALPGKCRQAEPWCSRTTGRRVDAWEAVTPGRPRLPALGRDMLNRLGGIQTPARPGNSLACTRRPCCTFPIVARGRMHVLGCQTRLQLAEGRPVSIWGGKVLQQARARQSDPARLARPNARHGLRLQPGQHYDLLVRVQATGR